jgi:hypothetical protein
MMKSVTIWLALLLSCSVLVTALQAETTGGGKVPKLNAEMQDELFSLSVALYIVEECGRVYTIDLADLKAFDAKMEETLRLQGFDGKNPANLDAAMSKNKIRGKALSYFRSRNLRDDNGASLCAAGQAEIAQKTRIGKYLVKK